MNTSSDSDSESHNSISSRLTTDNVVAVQKQTISIHNSDRPVTASSLPGVIFINSEELHFVDEQRSKHPQILWYPRNIEQYKKQEVNYKPSSCWFTRERPWLRPPPTQKSIFAQERPNGLKFSGYVGPKADSL